MRRRINEYNVSKVYQHKQRGLWYVVDNSKSTRQSSYYPTRAEAEHYRNTLIAALAKKQNTTIQDALDLFWKHLERSKNQRRSIVASVGFLKNLFRGSEHLAVAQVNLSTCRELYKSLTERTAVDTHRNTLQRARSLWQLLIEDGLADENHWKHIKGIGKRVRGKDKLSRDQARVLVAHCIERSKEGHKRSLGILFSLLLGLRACEALGIRKDSFDDGGTTIKITRSKSEAGKRYLELPSTLQELVKPYLEKLVDADLLFPYGVNWLNDVLQTTCAQLGLPVVKGHSLRGLFATLAVRAGMTSAIAATLIGHADKRTSETHYIDRDAIDDQDVKNAEDVLLH